MKLELATQLYELQAINDVRESIVEYEPFEEFCDRLRKLIRVTADLDDDSWVQPIRTLRYYGFDQCACPVGFGNELFMSVEKLEKLATDLQMCALAYETLGSSIKEITRCLRDLVCRNENPLFAEISKNLIEGQRTAILLLNSRHITVLKEFLKHNALSESIQVVSQQQLRKLQETFDLLICVGRSRWFEEFTFRAPRAREVRLVRYAWLPDSDCRKTPLFKGWGELRSKLEKQNKIPLRSATRPAIGSAIGTRERNWQLTDEELLPQVDLASVAARFDSGHTSDASLREDVLARLIELEGDRGAFVEADSIGALVIDLDENNRGSVVRVPVSSITNGMFLLLRGDADSDAEYIIPVADLILGNAAEQLRKFQQGWKSSLRDLLRKKGIKTVIEKLRQAGSKRASETNVRNWLWYRNIRTEEPEDFLAIMRVIGMGDMEGKCWALSSKIDSAHRKAGRLIRKELLRQVRDADMNELEHLGEMRFELEGIGGRPMLAVRIIRVSEFSCNVAPQNLNHVFSLEANSNG